MARRPAKPDDAEIAAVARQLDALLDDLAGSVEALSAILRRPVRPPGSDDERLAPL